MSKEIDLIKCIINEIDDNLYSDFGANPCIRYTSNLKKLLLTLNTPEVRHFFENCNNQAQQITDLEAKLAESEAKIACREDDIKFKEADINQLKWFLEGKNKDITQLKQQLAEKEKEKQDWIRAFEELALDSIDHESYNATVDEYEKEIEELKIYQNQTAIAELNNILDTFAIFVNEEKESMVSPDGNGNLSLLEYIENRIDTLKGETNGSTN